MRKNKKYSRLKTIYASCDFLMTVLSIAGVLLVSGYFIGKHVAMPRNVLRELLDAMSYWAAVMRVGLAVDVSCVCGYYLFQKHPKPLAEPIRAYHGDTMAEVMEALRSEKLEYDVACSLDGKVLAEGTLLSRVRCEITDSDFLQLPSAYISMHNHPDLSETPFSEQDIEFLLCDERCMAMIVVTSNCTYTLKWVDLAQKDRIDAEEFCDYVDRTLGRTVFLSSCLAKRYCIRQTRKIADRYGLEFTAEDLRVEQARAWMKANQKRVAVVAGCISLLLGVICGPMVVARDDQPYDVALETVSVDELAGQVNGHVDPPTD